MPPAFCVRVAREANNGCLLDGLGAQPPHCLTPPISPPAHPILQCKLESNACLAGVRRFAVQVTVTTRSETSDPRGSACKLFRSAAFDGRPASTGSAGPGERPLPYNGFRDTLGGTLMITRISPGRNRTLLFIHWGDIRALASKREQLRVSADVASGFPFSLGLPGNTPQTQATPPLAHPLDEPRPGSVSRRACRFETHAFRSTVPAVHCSSGRNILKVPCALQINLSLVLKEVYALAPGAA